MNANAQQINETMANWNRQWADAALGAVKAHEQFVTNMVTAMSKPVAMDAMPEQTRDAAEKWMDYTTRQALEGEKFFANMMRDGIEHSREFFKAQPEFAWPMDAEKTRAATDRFMQESARTTADVINREMAFVNERLNDAADFGRAMLGNLNATTESTDGKNKPRPAAKV
ncbi:MAG: hypothetical protein IT430_18040 [Phycisphaerales bacterium]|nr:hypothetical protein [Phycisphaerales bacterium]